MAHTASNPIRAYFVINFDLSAKKRLQSVVLRYFMQTSRVNGLTSGVFAFLVPASCLNQKGSDTCRDNTTFPVADYYLHLPVFVTETPGARKTCFFPFPRGGATEQRNTSRLRTSSRRISRRLRSARKWLASSNSTAARDLCCTAHIPRHPRPEP